MDPSQLEIYRRWLPHWRLRGATYFVTWRLAKSQPDLDGEEKDLIVRTIRHFELSRYSLLSYVVMNDHVHVLARPIESHRLRDVVHSWKSFTAREMQRHHGRRGSVWQPESFDRIVRDERELREKLQYIADNAKKRWPEIEEYPWLGWGKGIAQ